MTTTGRPLWTRMRNPKKVYKQVNHDHQVDICILSLQQQTRTASVQHSLSVFHSKEFPLASSFASAFKQLSFTTNFNQHADLNIPQHRPHGRGRQRHSSAERQAW